MEIVDILETIIFCNVDINSDIQHKISNILQVII